MTGALASAVVALRHVIVLLWIGTAVAASVALPSLGGAGTSLDDIVVEDSEALAAQERAVELFRATLGADTLVVARDQDGLDEETLARLARTAASASQIGVPLAVPVPNAKLPGLDWPESGTAVTTYLFLDPGLNLEERGAAADRYADRLAREGGEADGALAVGVTGAGPARLAQFETIDDALPYVEAATVAVILLIVAIAFRSLVAPVVTLVTALVAYAVAVRGLAWAAEQLGATAPREIEPVLVVLVLGLVTDYTVFYMAEARRRLADGESRLDAARATVRRITPIVLAAGLVVAGASTALLAGEMEFFRVFGPGLALCALVVTAVSVTFVPAVVALLGARLFGGMGTSRRPAAGRPLRPSRPPAWRGILRHSREQARRHGGHAASALVSRLLATRPVAILVVVAGVTGLVVAASESRSADPAVALISSLPEDAEARVAAGQAAAAFGPGVLAPADIIVERDGVADRGDGLPELQRSVERRAGVDEVIGPASVEGTPLRDLTVSDDGHAVRLVVLLADDPTSGEALETLESLREEMPSLLEDVGIDGARVSYAGETALAAETVDRTLRDLVRVAAVALVVILVLLVVFLRAIVAPVLLVVASALGLAAAFGLSALLIPLLLGGDDVVYYVPLVAGVLLIGLGSDYNVFIAGRIRQELDRRDLREAIAVGSASASGAVTVAGITLAATFALLALVPLRPFRELAIVMVVGILLDVLIVRRLLVPALLTLPGRLAWGRAGR